MRDWEHLWERGGELLGFSLPDTFASPVHPQSRTLSWMFSGFMYIKAWCLLHHIEVNGKVLLMLVPRGMWDRAGHFKGTASLFL